MHFLPHCDSPRRDQGSFPTRRSSDLLAELLTAPAPLGPGEDCQPPSLEGVEVVAQPHCHHHSIMGLDADAAILARACATVTRLDRTSTRLNSSHVAVSYAGFCLTKKF